MISLEPVAAGSPPFPSTQAEAAGALPPLARRLREIRRELRISQEAIGAQGIVSVPGWIKLENGQRQASDRLLAQFVRWMVVEHAITPTAATRLLDELITLKYLGHSSPFVRALAERHFLANHGPGAAGLGRLVFAELPPLLAGRNGDAGGL